MSRVATNQEGSEVQASKQKKAEAKKTCTFILAKETVEYLGVLAALRRQTKGSIIDDAIAHYYKQLANRTKEDKLSDDTLLGNMLIMPAQTYMSCENINFLEFQKREKRGDFLVIEREGRDKFIALNNDEELSKFLRAAAFEKLYESFVEQLSTMQDKLNLAEEKIAKLEGNN